MKSFKIEFSLAIIPSFSAITLALLALILILSFFSSINIAHSESFRLSSSPSPLQSPQQLQEQQKLLNTNGISITKNLNEQQTFHQPVPISLHSSPVGSPLSQQQQNQPPHQEQQQSHQHSNGINYGDKSDNYLATMAYPKPYSGYPEPLCYFNMGPLFCPHYLWVK
jgi:type III secretory pathway component EscV